MKTRFVLNVFVKNHTNHKVNSRARMILVCLLFWSLGCVTPASSQTFWKPIWVPVAEKLSAAVNDIAISPGGKVFISSDSIYESRDSGKSGEIIGSIGSSVLAPSSNGNLYAGTQSGLFEFDSAASSWIKMDTISVKRVAVLGDGTSVILGSWSPLGVYLSTNYGINLTRIPSLDSMYVSCVKVDSLDRIFVAGWQKDSDSSIYRNRLYVSINGGSTWERSQFPDSLTISSIDIAIDGASSIYAVDDSNLFQSTDGGIQWSIVSRMSGSQIVAHNGVLYDISGFNLLNSTDHGVSWDTLYNSGDAGTVRVGNSGDIFLGTSKGLYYSTNGGTTWTKGMDVDMVVPALSMVVGRFGGITNGNVFVGTSNGVYVSTDNGDDWSPDGLSGIKVYELAINFADSGFAATSTGLYKADLSWHPYWQKLSQDSLLLNPGYIAIDSLEMTPTMFFAGTDLSTGGRIVRSGDNGEHWSTSFQPGIPPSGLMASTGSHVYVWFDSGGVARTVDNGDTWGFVNNGLGSLPRSILSLAYNHKYLFCSPSGGVYRSQEDTVNWVPSGLQSEDVEKLAVDPQGGVYASTDQDLYYSSDNGDTWHLIDTTTPGALATLAVTSDKYAFALMQTGAIMRSTKTITGVEDAGSELPTRFALYQNYPNPFNPTTTINYQLPTNSFVMLRIYDVLGREVKTLVNERQTAGSHSVKFGATNLPSGVYFYRLSAGSYTSTKKALLLK